MSKLIITIERTSEYEQGVHLGKYPYAPEELAAHPYVVTLNNGDSRLFDSVQDIKDHIDGELFLHGFDDEGE